MRSGSPLPRLRAILVPAVVVYVVAVCLFSVWRGISVSPDYLLIVMLLGAAVLGRVKPFLLDWMPFLVLFLGYEALRGLAGASGIEPHFTAPIAFDTMVGWGTVPTVWLQQHLFRAGQVSPLDIAVTFVYFLHFAFPLTLGFVFWLRDRSLFRRYAATMLAMSYAAFVFFLLVPVAPPWLASQSGYLPHVEKIIDHTLPSATTWFYQQLEPNPVAAMPSLHMAYPVLGLLYAVRHFGRRGWLLALWCVAVAFTIVYLGEHYLADAIAGTLVAGAAYFCVESVYARLQQTREAQPALGPVELVE
ncbi:MAG: phosphatase PAP2 family protein [Candidatus Dormiibacterota bacterium]